MSDALAACYMNLHEAAQQFQTSSATILLMSDIFPIA
jgi:hypothetical protein